MILYFADRSMTIIGQASTNLPEGLLISDDSKKEDVETGVKTFTSVIEYDDREKAEKMTSPGNYLLRSSGGDAEFYTIIDSELNSEDGTVSIYAEDAGLDLINSIVGPYSAPRAMTIAEYTAIYNVDTGFEIGVNEVSTYRRTLEFDGEVTATERLQSLASSFDAEISFSFEIDRFHVVHKYINYWQKRGNAAGITLRVGEHISNLRIKRSVANLATGLYVTGGTPEGSQNPITLQGYSYDDGDMYVSGNLLLSRSAHAAWSRYLSPDETGTGLGHIIKRWSYSTTSQSELCARAVTQLSKVKDPEVNYEAEVVELPDGVKVGDTVRIVDAGGSLFLEARVLEMETRECAGEREITLGEYLIKPSGLSDRMTDMEKKVNEISQRVPPESAVSVETVSTSGGSAVLKAVLRVNGVITTPTSYSWTKGTDPTVIGTSETLTVNDLNAVYNCTVTW